MTAPGSAGSPWFTQGQASLVHKELLLSLRAISCLLVDQLAYTELCLLTQLVPRTVNKQTYTHTYIPVEFDFKGAGKDGDMDDAAHDQLKAVGDAVAHGHAPLEGIVHRSEACTGTLGP